MKRSVSFVLVVALLLAICGSVSATEPVNSVTYDGASAALIEEFESAGYDVPENAEFSLVPVSPTNARSVNIANGDMALCMTVDNGDTVTQSIILDVGQNDKGVQIVNNDATFLLRPQPKYTFTPGDSLSNKIRIVGTATYTNYNHNYLTYFQPQSCSFRYYRTSAGSSSSVTRAGVEFTCRGMTYYYPSYSAASSDNVTHRISCVKSNPTANLTYTTSNVLSGKVMLSQDQKILNYVCTINGSSYEYNIGFY